MVAHQDMLLAGRYRMGRLLGSGGFGAVYLATDERLHRSVAIKVCSTQRLPADEADEAARLFQSEALTLARLRHPGLTAIWDYFNQDQSWYLVMEYVPGETLRDLLRRVAGPLPQAEAIDYARQICAVLGYLHRQQPPVVFRDLKPANIMVTPEGQLKLIDFGIARLFSPGKAADTAQFGTPGYAPPEQYGGQTEPRSDIYSLGVVLHQMVTGHSPTSTPFALPPVHTINSALPEALSRLVTRATSYDLRQRIATADEFCSELDAIVTRRAPVYPAAPQRTVPISVPPQPTGPTTSRPLWAPSPRALPNRPAAGGMGRGIALIVLLVVLLGSLGAGAVLLRSQIVDFAKTLIEPIIIQPKPIIRSLPELTVFSAIANDGAETLYQINLGSGNDAQPLLQLPPTAAASQPAISPDGQHVAFTRISRLFNPDTGSWSDTGSEVWVMNLDGSQAQQLVAGYSFARSPAWSADGTWLALEVAKNGKAWKDHDVVVVNVDTGAYQVVADSVYWEGGPTWSPDGRYVVYHARMGVRCAQLFMRGIADDRNPTQLTSIDPAQCNTERTGDYWPDWSPDGTRIAFGRKLDGQERLMVLDLRTQQLQTLDTGTLASSYPRWSADSKHLLFEQGKGTNVSLARYDFATQTYEKIETDYPGSHLADWR